MRHAGIFTLCVLVAGVPASCTRIPSGPGASTIYEDPSRPGQPTSNKIESQDIISACDSMARDILACDAVMRGRTTPPRIVIDAKYFRNESSSVINKNLLTDRIRVQLLRASEGKLVFLARNQAEMVESERVLEQEGVVGGGTQGPTQQAQGWDYRLGGRIASLDSVRVRTGEQSSYHQITFELVARGTGQIVWTKMYEFKKSAIDDVVNY